MLPWVDLIGWELLRIFYLTVLMEGSVSLPAAVVRSPGLECAVAGSLEQERLTGFGGMKLFDLGAL